MWYVLVWFWFALQHQFRSNMMNVMRDLDSSDAKVEAQADTMTDMFRSLKQFRTLVLANKPPLPLVFSLLFSNLHMCSHRPPPHS